MFNRRHLLQSIATLAVPAGGGLAVPASTHGKTGRDAALPALGSTVLLPTLTLLDGSVWNPASLQAKALVVYWWASWSPFCAAQSPHIEALWRTRQAQGLQVLALSIDTRPDAAVASMKNKGHSFPAGLLTPDVARFLPKPEGLPVTVVLTLASGRGRGRVVFAEAGEMVPEDVEGLKKYI